MKISFNKRLIDKVTKGNTIVTNNINKNNKRNKVSRLSKLDKLNKVNKEDKENLLPKENKENLLTKEVKVKRRKIAIKEKNNKLLMLKNFKITKHNKVFYSIFMLMIILTSITTYINIKLNNNLKQESYIVLNSKENKTVNANANIENKNELNKSNNLDTRNEEKEVITQNVVNKNINNKNNNININKNKVTKVEVKEKQLLFVKPIEGKIIKSYSNKELLYSKTLETWKTHEGIDIQCNINDNIVACEEGIIEKIYNDSLYGNTIIIEHEKGYKTIYSNVLSKLKVKDKVNKNQILGKVDDSGIIESKDESHIHFMMIYNNEIINPKSMIKF